MKTTFTLLVSIVLAWSLSAQKYDAFHKKVQNQTQRESFQLKNGHLSFLPNSITTDTWQADAWQFYDFTSFIYDQYGNVEVVTTSSSRTTNTYDVNNSVTQSVIEEYDNDLGNFVNSSKYNYSYDSYNNISETIISDWTGIDWEIVGGSRDMMEYDSSGNIVSEIYSTYQPGVGWIEYGGSKIERIFSGDLLSQEIWYDREAGLWVPNEKTEWFYDSNDRPNLARDYNHNGISFVLLGRYTNVVWYIWNAEYYIDQSYPSTYTYQTYNGAGDINDGANYTNDEKMTATFEVETGAVVPHTVKETYMLWENGDWVNDIQETSIEKDNIISYKEEEWDGVQWLSTSFDETYVSSMMQYFLYETYVSGSLVSAGKSTKLFDAFGNLIEEKDESHYGNGIWIQSSGSEYSISYEGASSKMTERITKTWSGDVYVNSLRETFNYLPNAVDDLVVEKYLIYPTVFREHINIDSGEAANATFYSVTGNVVLQKRIFAGKNALWTGALPAGYYILKVNNETFKVIKK